MTRSLLASLLLAAAVTGCGGAATTATVDNAAPADDSFLVWSTPAGAAASTTWYDAAGRVLGTAPGMVIAHAGALWTLRSRTTTVELVSCAEMMDEPPEPDAEPPGAIEVTTLELVHGDDVIALNAAPTGLEVADASYAVTIQASLGRYVFVEDNTWVYACGAHGDGVSHADVIDLDTGAPVELVTADDVAHLVARASAQLTSQDDGDMGGDADATAQLGESLPRWTDGRLEMTHLFWVDACYACSDGSWSSYTVADWFDDARVPDALRVLPAVPPAVAAALGADAGPRGLSWGRADATWSATFTR